MAVPSARELELETLLRQRDSELRDLTDEVSILRRYLTNQPAPSTTEPLPLPPALLSLLLPHLVDPLTADPSGSTSNNSVTVALTQRAKLLQEENDELYELLKRSETGMLKEEVRGLRRALRRMEGALKESHTTINSLSTELEKCYDTLARTSSDAYASSGPSQSHLEAVRPPHATNNGPSAGKPIPTGPRAQKRPRLEQPSVSPQQAVRPLPASPRANRALPAKPRQRSSSRNVKMEVEEDRARLSPERERHRERDRGRERDRDVDRDRDRGRGRDPPPHQPPRRSRERDRDRDRERDRERGGRRSGGGRERRGARGSSHANGAGSRGLVERMGL